MDAQIMVFAMMFWVFVNVLMDILEKNVNVLAAQKANLIN